jgi:cytochrome c biogenesis protein CcmG, thiol:disulfide interchange protein DsbE
VFIRLAMRRTRITTVAAPRLVLALLLGCFTLTAAAEATDPLDLASLRGKVVLVDFWASWCEPCRHSFPWLNEMQAKYAVRGLVVIGVNVDREHADAERFLHDVPAQFRIVYDPAGSLATRYDLPGMPVSYVIGPNGDIVGRHVGFRNALRAEREAELQKLLEATR